LLEEFILGKYKGVYISALILPAMDDEYRRIEGHKTLHLSLNSVGNYRSVKREDIKPIFEEVEKRFLAKL
jgi:hypothetical protein